MNSAENAVQTRVNDPNSGDGLNVSAEKCKKLESAERRAEKRGTVTLGDSCPSLCVTRFPRICHVVRQESLRVDNAGKPNALDLGGFEHAKFGSDQVIVAGDFEINRESSHGCAPSVLAGGVLEEHLRKLCTKNGVDATITDQTGQSDRRSIDTLNAGILRRQAIIARSSKSEITAWAGIRNAAAHAERDKFDPSQAKQMIQGIRDFVAKCPA